MPLGGWERGGHMPPFPFHNATFNSKYTSHRKFSTVIPELPDGIKSMQIM